MEDEYQHDIVVSIGYQDFSSYLLATVQVPSAIKNCLAIVTVKNCLSLIYMYNISAHRNWITWTNKTNAFMSSDQCGFPEFHFEKHL